MSQPITSCPRWAGPFFAARDWSEWLGKAHVCLVAAAGAALTVWAASQLTTSGAPALWLTLALVTLTAGTLSVRVPSLRATVAMTDAFFLLLVVFFGPGPAVATIALDGWLTSRRCRNRSAYRTTFNVTEPAVSLGVAAIVYAVMSGSGPFATHPGPWPLALTPVMALVAVYLVLNLVLNTLAIRLETGVPITGIVGRTTPYLLLNLVMSLGLLLVVCGRACAAPAPSPLSLGVTVVAMALVFLAARWHTTRFETSAGDTPGGPRA